MKLNKSTLQCIIISTTDNNTLIKPNTMQLLTRDQILFTSIISIVMEDSYCQTVRIAKRFSASREDDAFLLLIIPKSFNLMKKRLAVSVKSLF